MSQNPKIADTESPQTLFCLPEFNIAISQTLHYIIAVTVFGQ